jgi:hypothetical protein
LVRLLTQSINPVRHVLQDLGMLDFVPALVVPGDELATKVRMPKDNRHDMRRRTQMNRAGFAGGCLV